MKKKLVLVSLSAILLSLPWLSAYFGWTLFFAFIPLLKIEDDLCLEKDKNRSIVFFGYSYLVFWLWNALTTWWVMHATLVGIVMVIFLNALFMAIVWWLVHIFKRNYGNKSGYFALIVLWITFEYLHYNWDIEWPWLTLGNGFANSVQIIQWYEFTGTLGGSLWVLLINLSFYTIWKTIKEKRYSTYKIIGTALVLLLPAIYSINRYLNYKESGDSVEVIVLQPNIDPYHEKFNELTPEKQVNRLVMLADSLESTSTDFIVGPETALPQIMENERIRKNHYILPLTRLLTKNPNVRIITGANTYKLFRPNDDIPETARKYSDYDMYYDVYNTALQIDSSSQIQTYHKSILVSGVEKMPFRKYLTFLENFIIDLGGTSGSLGYQHEPTNFGKEGQVLIAPAICYESIFGEYITKFVKKGAGLIFVITNDGWWKNTPGYRQHFSFSRLRAIETRRSIARSANTGISGFINQRGDILKKSSWWTIDALKESIHLNEEITFYVRYGDYIGRICSFLSVLILLYLFAYIIRGKRTIDIKKYPH